MGFKFTETTALLNGCRRPVAEPGQLTDFAVTNPQRSGTLYENLSLPRAVSPLLYGALAVGYGLDCTIRRLDSPLRSGRNTNLTWNGFLGINAHMQDCIGEEYISLATPGDPQLVSHLRKNNIRHLFGEACFVDTFLNAEVLEVDVCYISVL